MIGLKSAERDAAFVTQMQQIITHLLFGQLIRRAHVVSGQRANRVQIVGLGACRQTGDPHVLDHSLAQWCHVSSPCEVRRRDHCPGPQKDTLKSHALRPTHAMPIRLDPVDLGKSPIPRGFCQDSN